MIEPPIAKVACDLPLFLDNAAVRRYLSLDALLPAIAQALMDLSAGRVVQPMRTVLELAEPLETWMARTRYNAVVGVRSSALLFARQIYPQETGVIAFGWDRVRFKSKSEERDMRNAFSQCGVQMR